jgi:hypothetical protein
MKDISRRDAISKIATGAAGLGLVAASGELVTASQGSTVDTTQARAFRGQHQPRPLRLTMRIHKPSWIVEELRD